MFIQSARWVPHTSRPLRSFKESEFATLDSLYHSQALSSRGGGDASLLLLALAPIPALIVAFALSCSLFHPSRAHLSASEWEVWEIASLQFDLDCWWEERQDAQMWVCGSGAVWEAECRPSIIKRCTYILFDLSIWLAANRLICCLWTNEKMCGVKGKEALKRGQLVRAEQTNARTCLELSNDEQQLRNVG